MELMVDGKSPNCVSQVNISTTALLTSPRCVASVANMCVSCVCVYI